MEWHSKLANFEIDVSQCVDRIVQWSNINTHSHNVSGLERFATMVSQAFAELDCEKETRFSTSAKEAGAPNNSAEVNVGPVLRFWKRPEAPVQVLLVGHLDTVFSVNHPFQTCIRRSEKIIEGPGVSDMKGGLCVILEALKAFERLDISEQLGWEVFLNSDEEIGSIGSTALLRERAKKHQVGLVFEPAVDEKGTLAGERKGNGKFSLTVQGREAHAGRDLSLGRNAITQLSALILKIDALNGQREGMSINIGRVQGGGPLNVVPAHATCHMDIRIQTLEDATWIKTTLEEMVSTANLEEGFQAELHGDFLKQPKLLTGEMLRFYNFVADVGKKLGQTITWQKTGGVCDGNTLASVGLPNVDTLGVCGGGIHSAKEYLLVDSLLERIKLSTGILLELSAGTHRAD